MGHTVECMVLDGRSDEAFASTAGSENYRAHTHMLNGTSSRLRLLRDSEVFVHWFSTKKPTSWGSVERPPESLEWSLMFLGGSAPFISPFPSPINRNFETESDRLTIGNFRVGWDKLKKSFRKELRTHMNESVRLPEVISGEVVAGDHE